jgi:DNA repair protein RecN (Recombination protein N)
VIRTLRVRDLAVIEEIELELRPGLNVVTGETGAGKSVLLGAITALCGRRVSSEAIRGGANAATVEAIFEAPQLCRRAAELGLAIDEGPELLVVRRLSRDGRGRVFVNGALATVSLLSQLLSDTVEITSQGEHQQLLRSEVQSHLLDEYGQLRPLVREVAEVYARWHGLAREIHERRAHAEERARREDRLRFELDQIESVDPRVGELEALEGEHARLAHVDRLGGELDQAAHLLEGEEGVRDRLRQAQVRLRAAMTLDPSLSPTAEALERAQLELGEANGTLEAYVSALEPDPARLEWVEERLLQLSRLRERYGPTLEEILSYRDRTRHELERVGGGAACVAELEGEQDQLAGVLDRAARQLEKARRRAAAEFEAAVAKELAALGLRQARFAVAWHPLPGKTREGWEAPSSPQGRERASFRLAANPGEEPRALRDAASGGELSRLLLAVRNVHCSVDAGEGAERGRVLLFDEVDAGIGGRTAGRVGERLRRLAAHHQILCITHLPQIAALAQTHYRVEKRLRGQRSVTSVERLEGELRVEEIARMAAGGRVTSAARAHARELLAR